MTGIRLSCVLTLSGCEVVFPLDGPEIPQACRDDSRYAPILDVAGVDDRHLYRLELRRTPSWPEAQAICVSESSHLVALDSFPELDAIVGILATTDPNLMTLWVGVARDPADVNATDLRDAFRLVTGEPTPATLWKAGEPNNFTQIEFAAELDVTARGLLDKEFTAGNEFVCECDGKDVVEFELEP